MAAAKAAKESKKPKAEEPQPSLAVTPPALPGHVDGLSLDARQEILRCNAKVIVGYGTLEAFYPLVEHVSLALLQHYVPQIVDNFKHTTAIGDIILLPDDMTLVTERGLRYVFVNMRREVEWGSYASSHFTKDKKDQATYTMRPCRNPVDMIHGLHTLRAFGLSYDAEFLAMPDGPIISALERRAVEWSGNLWTLKRFLNTVDRELLGDPDRHLLARAWDAYDKRVQAQPPRKTSGQNA
ncbi:hypothetical protein INS49_003081 [Diaporthe citri]|uniref:uncharacterized protein n=1 Tax=Diaporthe citri TaxID=83186 RepID=UPI001C80395F|nr:uncharacterized protein INS49_003081 [Diaporthe citri]KAG6368865.1 hypothetical protein INS49_003081 [Diaporthe citri]